MPSAPSAADGLVSVFEEVLRLAGSSGGGATGAAADAVGMITARELEEIRTLRSPPAVVRRTLEATFLLLNAASAASPPAPPSWTRVQKMLADAAFLARMREYDTGSLRSTPALTSFVASEYFGNGPRRRSRSQTKGSLDTVRGFSCSPSRFSRSPSRTSTWAAHGQRHEAPEEPLTYQRVAYASRAAGALFGWCTATLVDALELPVPVVEQEAAAADSEDEPRQRPSAAEVQQQREAPPPPPPAEEAEDATVAARLRLSPASPVATVSAATTVAAAAGHTRAPPPPGAAPATPSVFEPFVMPAAAAATPSPKVIPATAQPDRHFEVHCCFDMGYAGLSTEGEPALQTVAATLCMRRQLGLELVGCPAAIESEALNISRLEAVEAFFLTVGLAAMRSEEPSRVSSDGGSPGVVCMVHLKNDRELRDYFLMREEGDEFQLGRATKSVVQALEEDFTTCRHE